MPSFKNYFNVYIKSEPNLYHTGMLKTVEDWANAPNHGAFNVNAPINTQGASTLSGQGANDETCVFYRQKTGWHFIPGLTWDNYLTLRQYMELMTNTSAFKLTHITHTVMNLQPIIQQLALGDNRVWSGLNQTSEALFYVDDFKETFAQEFISKDHDHFEKFLTNKEGIDIGLNPQGIFLPYGKRKLVIIIVFVM